MQNQIDSKKAQNVSHMLVILQRNVYAQCNHGQAYPITLLHVLPPIKIFYRFFCFYTAIQENTIQEQTQQFRLLCL